MKLNIEISENNLQEVAILLNRLLANEYILYTKTRRAHWNIQGIQFIALHEFFKSQYDALDSYIDDIAERVRALGHYAIGDLHSFLEVADILENGGDFTNAKEIVHSLANDHETIIRIIRNEIRTIGEKYRDLGTADFVTGIMEGHEKMAWMLRAHLFENEVRHSSMSGSRTLTIKAI